MRLGSSIQRSTSGKCQPQLDEGAISSALGSTIACRGSTRNTHRMVSQLQLPSTFFDLNLESIVVASGDTSTSSCSDMERGKSEMKVIEQSDLSLNAEYRKDEQKDEVLVYQTESNGSAEGLIPVGNTQTQFIKLGLRLTTDPGLYSISHNRPIRIHAASCMGGVGSFDSVQLTQRRACIIGLRKSAGRLWNMLDCIIIGRDGVHVR